MSIQIKLKNSVVQDSTPSTSDLPEVGELAVNANINSIGGFMRASNNTIVKIFGPGSVTTPTATTTVSGISELATNSETTTGTATNRVVTPAGLNAVTVAERTTSNTNYVAKAGSTMTGVLQVTAGSSSAPAIHFGDSDSGIYAASGGNNVRIAVGGSDAISASTAGGINFSLAARALTSLTLGSQSATDKPLFFADANSVQSSSLLLDNSSNEFRVRNNRFSGKIVFAPSSNVEKARIDNAGRLLVGTSSARTNFKDFAGNTVTPPILFETANDDTAKDFALVYGRNNTNSANFLLGKHRTSTVGGNTIVQSGDSLGTVGFLGSDGTTFRIAASVTSFCDGTPGSNDMPGRLVFSTTADGASSPTTRLTIDSAGTSTFTGNITTTGQLFSSYATLTAVNPTLTFSDSNNDPDYTINVNSGVLKITDSTNSADRLVVNSDGHIDIAGNLDVGAGIDVTGAITGTGDVTITKASDTAKLSLISTGGSGQQFDIRSINSNGRFAIGTASNNHVLFESSNNNVLIADNAGNVGIGTTSPRQKLDVTGNIFASNGAQIQITGTASSKGLQLIGQDDGTSLIGTMGSSGEHLLFRTASNERMRIDTSGNVGIGTTSPSEILHLNSSVDTQLNISSDGDQFKISCFSNGDAGLETVGSFPIRFFTASTERMRIDSSGNVRITNEHLRFDTTGKGIIFGIEGGSNRPSIVGNYTSSTNNNIAFNVTGSERMRIDSSGNVLIGTTTLEDTTGNSGPKIINTGDITIDGNRKALVFRSTQSSAHQMSGIQWWNENGAGVQCAIHGIRESLLGAPGSLAFYTSNDVDTTSNSEGSITEAMRIDSNQRILLGTTVSEDTTGNSGTKVISAGDITIDGDQKALVFRSTASAAQIQSGIQWWNENGAGVMAKIHCIRETIQLGKGALAFYTNTDVDTTANNSEGDITEQMRITSDGKVGIGTTSPNFNVEVAASGGGDGATLGISNTGADPAGLRLNSGHGNWSVYNSKTVGDALEIRDETANSTRMIINSSGDIGIGTTSPTTGLHVNGSARVNQFLVNTSGVHNSARITVVGHTTGSHSNIQCQNSDGTQLFLVRNDNHTFVGTLSKSAGSFFIDHPLPSLAATKTLRHSFIEGPQCDNIYRGKVTLSSGTASINLDTVSKMTEGTFVVLNRDVQCFTTNETGFDSVKGSVENNILTIICENNSSADTISWMVVGERQDPSIKTAGITDDDGYLLVEEDKVAV